MENEKAISQKKKEIILWILMYPCVLGMAAASVVIGTVFLDDWFWPIAVFFYVWAGILILTLIIITIFSLVKKQKKKKE